MFSDHWYGATWSQVVHAMQFSLIRSALHEEGYIKAQVVRPVGTKAQPRSQAFSSPGDREMKEPGNEVDEGYESLVGIIKCVSGLEYIVMLEGFRFTPAVSDAKRFMCRMQVTSNDNFGSYISLAHEKEFEAGLRSDKVTWYISLPSDGHILRYHHAVIYCVTITQDTLCERLPSFSGLSAEHVSPLPRPFHLF